MSFANKTAAHFYRTSYIVFFLGSPNFWIEDLKVTKPFYRVYRRTSQLLNALLPCFIVFELGSFVTQRNMTKKQETDLMIYGISHPLLYCYSLILWSHCEDVRKLFAHVLRLKNFYNDEQIEGKMLQKSNRDSMALTLSCILSVVLHTISAFMEFMKSEGTFTTVITTWPLVDDPSTIAHIARLVNYVIWWVFVTRIISSYIIIIVLITSMSQKYMNLQSYFNKIERVFVDRDLEQNEKEIKYEESFKLGVKLHSSTLECIRQFRHICEGIFSAQIIFVITMLVFLMTQMMKSERTVVNAAATAITATAVLISTGFFMWNAGDITVEASNLANAMYCSGWHNCHGVATTRIRKLVMIAVTHAQRPVVINGLGMIPLSYRSYLSIVKSSYSVFSVIY